MEYLDFAGIGALILAIVALYKAWKGEPKQNADAAKIWQEMTATAALANRECQKRMDEFEAHLGLLQGELDEYREGVDKLIKQLEQNRIKPVWRPRRRE